MRDELKKANDPVPLDSVGIADAFDAVLEQAHEEDDFLRRIEKPAWIKQLNFFHESSLDQADPHTVGVWAREQAADIFFRIQLQQRSLIACVLDPRTGLILKLGASDWLPRVKDAWRVEPFRDDFIDLAEGVFGPSGTIIEGRARPVFLMKDAFRVWFERTFPAAVRVGRPPGSGTYRGADEPLIAEMETLLKNTPSMSVQAASRLFAEKAEGAGTLESKAKRLERRYLARICSRGSL